MRRPERRAAPPLRAGAAPRVAGRTMRAPDRFPAMSDYPPSRRFDDETAALILRRAAELQHSGPQPGADQPFGLSETDLEQAAFEAGIDPAYVRRAISEVGASPPVRGFSSFLGSPMEIDVSARLDRELSLEGLGLVVEEVQRTLDDAGETNIAARTLTWKSSKQLENRRATSVSVTITPRDGRTEIRIREHLGGQAGALFGGLMGGLGGGGMGISVGVGLGALGSALAAFGGVALFVGGSYLLARTIYARSVAKRERELRGLLDRLQERGRLAPVAGGPSPEALPGSPT
jgi:hypothetical protein